MTKINPEYEKSLASSGQALIWTSDPTNRCEYFNRPWLDFTGRTLDQVLKYGWAEGLHPDDVAKCINTFETAFKNREKFRMEFRLLHFSGDYKWMAGLGSPRFNDNKEFEGYIVQCFDISENKKLVESIIEAKEKAEKSNLIKTTFLNNISHEVRTPLNVLLGFGSLLTEPNTTEDERVKYFSLLQDSGNRLVNTINDYMNISLLVSGNLAVHVSPQKTLSIIDFSKTKFAELSGAKSLNFKLEIPAGGETLILNTDFDLVKNIIHHLLDNAVKFTDKGEIVFGFTINAKNLEFFIKDTGSGIDTQDQIDIFEMFSQKSISETEVSQRSGRGLYIVKGILNLLGGHIRLVSSKGKGSEFYFTLPVKPDAGLVANNLQISDMLKEEKLPVVLAVDDEETNSIYIEAVLRKYASKVIKAYNGKEAVDICRSNPDISIVLMDIKMPVMNGLDATKEIKSFRRDLPIIAVTAYAMAEDEKIALEAGCDDYLAKPFTYARLIEKVRKYTSQN